jgi:hypothetical protein
MRIGYSLAQMIYIIKVKLEEPDGPAGSAFGV